MKVGAKIATASAVVFFTHGAAARTPTPAPPRWVPTVSWAVGTSEETLRLRIDGGEYTSHRSQLRMLPALGLAHHIGTFVDGRSWLDGHASLGAGPTFETGHWLVRLREDVTFAMAATRWLTLRGGLGAGLVLDATATARSSAELSLPLGLALWDTLELVYRPFVSAPLGSERNPIFGGQRELGTRFGVVPFELELRVRFVGLGW